MSPNDNLKNLISEIYLLNFFQKCKLIEKIENTSSKSELREIKGVLLKIKKIQEAALKNSGNKMNGIHNLIRKSKLSQINVSSKNNKDKLNELIEKIL